jgi:hypothetical protein
MASRGGFAKGDHFARRAQEICASHVGKRRGGITSRHSGAPHQRRTRNPERVSKQRWIPRSRFRAPWNDD